MSEPSATRLLRAGTAVRHDDGAAVFREGDSPGAVYVVVHGNVRIEVGTPTGGRLVLALKGPGDLVGELGAIDGRPRSATAVAVGRVELRQVAVAEFLDLLEHDGIAAVRLLRELAAELRASDDRTAARESADVLTRLAHRLCELAERFGAQNPTSTTIDLRLTQDDLAGWIGATREATARALRVLREDGCVTTGRRRISVVDLGRLRAVAS